MFHTAFAPLLTILITFGLLCASQAKATDICEKHLKRTCNNCHTLEAVCERLGSPVKEWKEILSQMINNGANLGAGDMEALASCLSQPSTAAKAACKK